MKLDALKEILYHLVGVLYDVHKELGPGLNEYVYQEGLEFELKNQSIPFEREKRVSSDVSRCRAVCYLSNGLRIYG